MSKYWNRIGSKPHKYQVKIEFKKVAIDLNINCRMAIKIKRGSIFK